MSSLFKQISEQAAQQRAQISQGVIPPTPELVEPSQDKVLDSNESPSSRSQKKNKQTNNKVVPHSGTMVPETTENPPHLDLDKLKIIIEELSQMPTKSNGLNVRMSDQEMQDIEDFVLITLRKQGLRGYEVSVAKLMRYALRYMFRVHEKEFISALKQVLKTEETLSI